MTRAARLTVAAAVALVGALSVFGPLSRYFIGDALVPVHVSLTHWEPYYWGQARYGMLIPLLAMPVREPLLNFIVQNWMTATFGATFFFAMAARIERGATAIAAGACALALFLLLDSPESHRFYLSSVSQYGTGLSLGLAGSIAWHRRMPRARALGGVLLALAVWVDISAALFLLPLEAGLWLVADWELLRSRKWTNARTWTALATDRSVSCALFILAAMAVEAALIPTARTTDTNKLLAFTPPSAWFAGWTDLAVRLVKSFPAASLIAVVLISSAALIYLSRTADRSTARESAALALVMVVVIAIRWIVLGLSLWVRENGFEPKYLIPSRVLLFVLPAFVAVRAIVAVAPRSTRALAAAGFAGAILGLSVRYPFRSPDAMRRTMEQDPGLVHYADEIMREGCTHFVGWDQPVWQTTFYLEQIAYETGTPPVVGVALKSKPERVRWSEVSRPGFKICAPIHDHEAKALGENLGWPPLEISRELETIDVFGVKADSSRQPML